MARFQRIAHPPVLSSKRDYQAYRSYVRSDFQECCAYCLRHEDWAEPETFELDHFFPKSLFPEKQYDFHNLYYACRRCNKRKGKLFPSEDVINKGMGFVDLCQDDFSVHYEISAKGIWQPLTESARFTIRVLSLNSEFLVLQRVFLAQGEYDIEKANPERTALKLED